MDDTDGLFEKPSSSDEAGQFFVIGNISESGARYYLAEMREENVRIQLPSTVMLVSCIVLGVIGNSLVLLVYGRGFRHGPVKVAIMAVAALDLFSSLFIMPAEVYTQYHWEGASLCKLRQYLKGASTIGSGAALVLLAVIRYSKVCRPFQRHMNSRQAVLASVAIVCLSLLGSSPLLVLKGRQTKLLLVNFTWDVANSTGATESLTAKSSSVAGKHFGADVTNTSTLLARVGFGAVDRVSAGVRADLTGDTIRKSSGVPENGDKSRGMSRRRDLGKTSCTGCADNRGHSTGLADNTTRKRRVGFTIYLNGCSTADAYKDTVGPTIVVVLLLLVFIASATSMIAMYALIAREACRGGERVKVQQVKWKGDVKGGRMLRMFSLRHRGPGETPSITSSTTTSTPTPLASTEDMRCTREEMPLSSPTSDETSKHAICVSSLASSSPPEPEVDEADVKTDYMRIGVTMSIGARETKAQPDTTQGQPRKSPRLLNRTTVMIIVITAIYIIGYTSHIIAFIFPLAAPKTFEGMGISEKAVFYFIFGLFNINFAANPVVYSFWDPGFRKQCVALLKRARNLSKK